MRYAKLSCIEFYSCYLQQCFSIDLFSYRNPGRGQKGLMNKVCPSFCSKVFLELALQFFLELSMMLGPMCSCAWQMGKIGQAQGSLNVQGNLVIDFFSIWSIIKVYINCCMLEQISYLGKFWFLRYSPKCSWPIRLVNFQIKYLQSKMMKKPDFLRVDTNSSKLKVD